MKLFKITRFYRSYLKDFYRKHPGLAGKSFAEQKAALDYDAFGWADYWTHALTPLGYEVMEITCNAMPMQRAWAKENALSPRACADPENIALAQAKSFKPDIVWFDDIDDELLQAIRAGVPSLKVVLGWVGSAVPRTRVWRHMDLILSCAPESVEYLEKNGFPSEHLHHAFDPRINDRLEQGPKQRDLSFIGQLVRLNQFHMEREHLLEQLATKIGIDIVSPSAEWGWKDDVTAPLIAGAYYGMKALKAVGVPESALRALPMLGKVMDFPPKSLRLVDPVLKPFLKPGVFGLEMFQVLRDSRITLNIHADSSPRFASNMRLFETTGVGTCMVTDWKDNLPELFEPDKQVVTYRTADECVEKVAWLLDHPKEREEIARAGQARTLREHTFAQRALLLNEIIHKQMKAK